MISTQPSIQTLAEEARCPQCGMTRDERAAYSDNCPMRVPSIGCPFFDAKEKAMTPNARDKELAEETARERYNDCLDPANVPQDARVVDAIEQALAKQREAQFSWLFSHCHAIGMTKKSISGTQEHDIALFTADLKERAEQSESTLGALQLQFELRGEIVEKLTRERYMYSQLAAKRDAAVAEALERACTKVVETCQACGGSGGTDVTVPICCNRPTEAGDCCNNPIPDRQQEQCQYCGTTTAAIRSLKPSSDLPQCHPTWTECPLCHNDIKRMPEGCQFKPSAPKVEKEAAGMVSVPREPTDAMVDAGAELCLHGQDVYRLREIYKAMLAAGAKE